MDAADDAVRLIERAVKSTHTERVLGGTGLFGGFYELVPSAFRNPVLVSSTDGVGTKLKLAFATGSHRSVGADLVNHCVNDILVHGASPLFFLDYIATGKLHPPVAAELVGGMSGALKAVGCALVGGETAEMPGFYREGEYDLCGTIVGVVEKERIIDGGSIRPEHRILGLASSGLHTNGYTLARKVLLESGRFTLNDRLPELDCTLGEELLRIHRCYYNPVRKALDGGIPIAGMAHVTGGGIPGNLKRILPEGCSAQIDTSAWRVPPVFEVIEREGKVACDEMYRVFNMGIGFIVVTPPEAVDLLKDCCSDCGPVELGTIIEGDRKVLLKD